MHARGRAADVACNRGKREPISCKDCKESARWLISAPPRDGTSAFAHSPRTLLPGGYLAVEEFRIELDGKLTQCGKSSIASRLAAPHRDDVIDAVEGQWRDADRGIVQSQATGHPCGEIRRRGGHGDGQSSHTLLLDHRLVVAHETSDARGG